MRQINRHLFDPGQTDFPLVTASLNAMSNRQRGKIVTADDVTLGILNQALEQIKTDETLSVKLDEYGIDAIEALGIGEDFLNLVSGWPSYFVPKVIWSDAADERVLYKNYKDNRSGFRKLVLRTYPESLLEFGLLAEDIESLRQKETHFASVAISIDHNIPLLLGGKSETENLVLMHPIVNAWKGGVVEAQDQINKSTGGFYIIPYVLFSDPRREWFVGRIDNKDELIRLETLTRKIKTKRGHHPDGRNQAGGGLPPTVH